jgi:DNA-binding NarL/FixJ family response regulator
MGCGRRAIRATRRPRRAPSNCGIADAHADACFAMVSLIVDDSAVFRKSMRRLLAGHFSFMRIGEAATVSDAKREARTLKPDLVFVDLRLPDGNGLDLSRWLASTLPQSAICIITSFDLPEYRSAARDCGAQHYLSKGTATSADVVAILEELLAKRVRMLIIDDDAGRRSLIAHSVSAHWPTVILLEAIDDRDGFDKASAFKPNLVLIGLPLDSSTGPRLCGAIKAIDPATTIVVVNLDAECGDHESELRSDVDHVVMWNVGIDVELASILHSVIARQASATQRTPGLGSTRGNPIR